ncbi:MAG: hemolysin family protein [Trueperaceae bacterium]
MREVGFPLLVVALLIILNGVFVAAEFATVAASGRRLAQGDGGRTWTVRYVRRVLSSAASRDRYIAIAQLGITLATIGLGMYGEPSIAAWIYGPIEGLFGIGEGLAHTAGTVVAVVVLTYFHVVVGEMIPKAIALQAPERTAVGVARVMHLTGMLFYPLVALLNAVATALLRLLRIPVSGESRHYSSAELVHLIQESHEEGAVSEEEQRLIRNILDFGERQVRQVMVPRVRLRALPIDAGWEEAGRFLAEYRFTRYPVYRGHLDRVVGILHVKDFIRHDAAGEPVDLRALVRRVPRIPETLPIENLLESFRRLHVHMAIVVDEYGGTSGIVTLDDLLEEVVGEVDDEFGEPQPPEVEPLRDGRFLVDGALPLHRFNEHFGTALEAEESTTVAGFILERLKRVPVTDDEVTTETLILRVQEIEGQAIRRLLVEILAGGSDRGDET